jgi:hypothetical protein
MFRIILFATLLAASQARAEDTVALKPGPELDTVTSTCGACHSLAYIRMNSTFLSPDGWKAEVTKMQKAFGGPFDDETAASIVKYLAANYAVTPKP